VAVTTRAIHCTCGRWLADVSVTPHRQVLRLSTCPICHRRHRPSTPVVFIREDGQYFVLPWWGRVDAVTLPWPDTVAGWR
jgi:hypothetical protein